MRARRQACYPGFRFAHPGYSLFRRTSSTLIPTWTPCQPLPRRFDRASEGVHQVDYIAWGGSRRRRFRRQTRLLAPEHFDNRPFVAVLERRRIEIALLGFEDVLGELDHLARHLDVFDAFEIFIGLAHLMGVAKRHRTQPLAQRLECDRPLPGHQYYAGNRHHVLAAHRLADHCESLLADWSAGHNV